MGAVWDDDGEDSDEVEWAELENAYVKAETEKALLVRWDGREHWIPRSQIADEEVIHKFYRGVIFVTLWFAEKEGIL